jgi:hypothetical protein
MALWVCLDTISLQVVHSLALYSLTISSIKELLQIDYSQFIWLVPRHKVTSNLESTRHLTSEIQANLYGLLCQLPIFGNLLQMLSELVHQILSVMEPIPPTLPLPLKLLFSTLELLWFMSQKVSPFNPKVNPN